jgi:hypothetical protein
MSASAVVIAHEARHRGQQIHFGRNQRRNMTETMTMQPQEAPPQAVTFQVPSEIEHALDRLVAAQEHLAAVRDLIDQAKRGRADVDRDYQGAFTALSESEAAVAAEGANPNVSLRKTVQQHQQAVVVQDARIAGLQGRERKAIAVLDQAMRDLDLTHVGWIASETDKARLEFQAALDIFVEATEKPIAVGIALNDSHLAAVARSARIPSATHIGQDALLAWRYWRETEPIFLVVSHFSNVKLIVAEALGAARVAARQTTTRPVDQMLPGAAVEGQP